MGFFFFHRRHVFKFKKVKACIDAEKACVQLLATLAVDATEVERVVDAGVGGAISDPNTLMEGVLPEEAVFQWAGASRRLTVHMG